MPLRAVIMICLLCSSGCQSTSSRKASTMPMPPVAQKQPKTLSMHGHTRTDDYYWLKHRDDAKVIDYLEAENHYTDTVMAHTEDFRAALFEEIKGRIKQTDMSVPYKKGNYYYYTRIEDGQQYSLYCRKHGSLDGTEQVMIDGNILAEGHDYFAVGGAKVSHQEDILAFATDTQGRRIYDIYFKNLQTGEVLDDVINGVTGNMAWANDNRTLFYSKQDPETLRSYRVYRHTLGTDAKDDVLVYEEQDETFSAYILKTKSKKYLMIASYQTLSSEYRFVDASQPQAEFEVFLPRRRDHEYDVDHYQDYFYVRSNDQAKNFKLMRTPVDQTDQRYWQEVIGHREDVLLSGFEIFRDHLVVAERKNGLIQLRVKPWNGTMEHYLEFDEPAYLAYPQTNLEFDTPLLRYTYTSMTTPNSVYDYNMITREKKLLKRQEVLGGFDSQHYETDRLYAPARDGTMIPISIVYRQGFKKNGQAPLLLYGYGSYGYSIDASFSSSRLSLIDRGFAYAIAHIRGGQELGRSWYDNGKTMNKKNTFTDFIDCARFLVNQGYTSTDHLYAMGGSAGGLLMGAIINMEPDLFNGVVAKVPFVDVITTMLDPDIPLTTGEYDEWGNPNDKDAYDYILSYSPYDNVVAQAYPHMLVTTGLHDSQVQYWEPAKWVAKLRTHKTDNHRLLLKTNMEAGHGGGSGRYQRYKETAFDYAFLLDLEGHAE